MKYDTVIFDLDGTLVNTIPDIVTVVNSVIEQIGMTKKTEEQVSAGVGFGVEHLLRTLGVPEQLNSSLALEVEGGYASMKDSKAFVYPGVLKMIIDLSRAGIKLFVLSNKPQRGLEKSLSDHLAFAEFQSARGSQLGKPAKPLPDVLLRMLSEFNISPETVIMVGDGEPDVLVSKAAGVDCLSVLWGFRTRKALEAEGAKMFAETPADVVDLILPVEQ
ncbi:MAG: HAD family hydrolase [Candidatus Sabulitectum sp.]|nr:HAD family hydrolase [Candidatus Sabulitectum sp.]